MNMQHIRAVFVCIDVVYGMVDSLYFNHSHCHVRAALQYVSCICSAHVKYAWAYIIIMIIIIILAYMCVSSYAGIYIYICGIYGWIGTCCMHIQNNETNRKKIDTNTEMSTELKTLSAFYVFMQEIVIFCLYFFFFFFFLGHI